MSTLLQQLKAFHEQLDPQRRRVLYVALSLALATVIGVGFWATQDTMVAVADPASADDLAEQTARLAQAGILFEVDPNTRTIRVASTVRAEALAALNPTDTSDDASGGLMETPDAQRYRRILARQKELERTINGYDGVLSSKVNLNIPEASPFFKDDHTATASVMVRAEQGVVLSPKLGRTIARAVSGASEGMSLYDVSVSDAAGRELWPGEMDNDETGNAAVQSARRESELSRALLASLSQILGSADDLTVSVSVDLDTAKRHQRVKQLDPNSAVTMSENVKTIRSGARPAEGVPGTDTNLPEATPSTSGSAPNRSEDITTTTYDYSNTETTTETPAGGVRRLTASVVINSEALARVLGVADGQTPDEKAVAALKADLEEATRAALGFDATRGDLVVVKFIKFAPVPVEAPVEPSLVAQAEPYGPLAVALVAALAVVFGVIRPLLKMVRPASAATEAGTGAAGEAAMVMGPDGKLVAAANGPMGDEPPGETSVDLMERLRNYIENYQAVTPGDLSDLVRRETVHSAEVVRRWIRG